MGSATLTNSIATLVYEAAPTTNYDNTFGLGLSSAGGATAYGLLYFSRPYPLNATILSAKIKFYNAYAYGAGTHTFTLQRLNQSFSAAKVTWNTRPTSLIAGTKTVTKSGSVAVYTEWEVDVTDWAQTVANGGVSYGVRISSTETVSRTIISDIHPLSQYRPRLEVTWSDAPQTPSGLAPSGGRAVGLNKPILRCTYIDVSGSTSLQAIQVQINSTDSWGAPSFDSGTVLTSTPELDLAATAYAGVTDGVTVFWRVRLQDAAGVWSAWSAAVSFKRDDKGTLSLTNPPSGTPKVEDTTPPIIWTFTGETQSAYQIYVEHTTNGVKYLDWNSGKVTSTATTVTVPSGKIVNPSTTYNVTVRIWDSKDREATPNSPTFQELARDFTFIPGATTGTTGLTAVADSIRPKVTLTWQRTSSPDTFNVLRNGKVIQGGLLPGDVFVSGTTYSWVDNSPSPGRALTYSVQGVVGGVASATNASAVVTITIKGVWIREPVAGLEVCMLGLDGRDFTLGEESAVLRPIATNSPPVAINQTLGGLEGRLEGTLENMYGKTAQEWRDQFLQIRGLRVKKVWVTLGDYTFQAVVQRFNYTQLPTAEVRFRVSCDVYQQDSITSAQLGS